MPHSFFLGQLKCQPISVTDEHVSFFLLGANWIPTISVTDGHASFFLLGATWTPTYLSQWSAFIVLSSRGNFNTHFGRPFCLPFLFFLSEVSLNPRLILAWSYFFLLWDSYIPTSVKCLPRSFFFRRNFCAARRFCSRRRFNFSISSGRGCKT